jgi:hypothetical protein
MSEAEPPKAELGDEEVAKTYRREVADVIPEGKSAKLT